MTNNIQTKIYNEGNIYDGKYVGELKNGLREEKELYIIMMVKYMKVNGKMIKEMERE